MQGAPESVICAAAQFFLHYRRRRICIRFPIRLSWRTRAVIRLPR
jgi:hypothetical protein